MLWTNDEYRLYQSSFDYKSQCHNYHLFLKTFKCFVCKISIFYVSITKFLKSNSHSMWNKPKLLIQFYWKCWSAKIFLLNISQKVLLQHNLLNLVIRNFFPFVDQKEIEEKARSGYARNAVINLDGLVAHAAVLSNFNLQLHHLSIIYLLYQK